MTYLDSKLQMGAGQVRDGICKILYDDFWDEALEKYASLNGLTEEEVRLLLHNNRWDGKHD